MKVLVCRNLNRTGYTYSIKSLEGPLKNRIVGYLHGAILENCHLIVNQAGRKRVLLTKRMIVHAGVVGDLVAFTGYQTRIHNTGLKAQYMSEENWLKTYPKGIDINYHPFLNTSFVICASNQPIHEAKRVQVFHDRVEVMER